MNKSRAVNRTRAANRTWAYAAMSATMIALAACGASPQAAPEPPSVLVKTQPPQQGSIPRTVSAYGTALPAINGGTTLSVQVEGRVLRLAVTPGQTVHAGQPLLDFEISAAARSTYEQATSALALARNEQVRTTRLLAQQLATRDQLARADKAGARAVVIIGQEDWDAGNVTVRSLATREQQQVPVDSAAATVTTLLA